MICIKTVSKFCNEEISKIENYDLAIKSDKMWHCHHRLEIVDDKLVNSKQDLISKNMYYNRPASELIFMTSMDHRRLHNRFYVVTDEMKKLISEHTKKGMEGKMTEEVRHKISVSLKNLYDSGLRVGKNHYSK